eukprot:symbB.v1.2.014039.t1/scaffold999.1/size145731/3
MNEQTVHLAVKLLHDFSGQEGSTLDPELAELACVKLAESMNEVSHEETPALNLQSDCCFPWLNLSTVRAPAFEQLRSPLSLTALRANRLQRLPGASAGGAGETLALVPMIALQAIDGLLMMRRAQLKRLEMNPRFLENLSRPIFAKE